MKRLNIKLFILLFFLAFPNILQAQITIQPSDTATSCVDSERVSFPCGEPHLGPGIVDDLGWGPIEQRAAIEFSLIEIATVHRAELHLVATGWSPYPEFINDPILEFHGYVGDGVVQYTDLFVNNLLFTTGPISELELYIFDVTEYVTTLNNSGAEFVGFSVRDIMPNSFVSFNAAHNGSNTLVLEGTVVPEPVSSILFITGGATLGIRRFIKRKHS